MHNEPSKKQHRPFLTKRNNENKNGEEQI